MQRISGVDVARGLAVLGMITAHVGPHGAGDPWPWSLMQVVDGRSAALFVLLSGVSVALLSGGIDPVAGIRRVQARTRLLVRAFSVLGLGIVVLMLDTPIAVILPTYALLFAVATTLLGATGRRLLIGAAVVAAVGPVVRVIIGPRLAVLSGGEYTDLVTGSDYPALVWFAYVLVGLAVGRMDLRDTGLRWRLLGIGAGLAAVGHGASALLTRAVSPDSTLGELVTTAPHASSPLEVVANTGVGLGALALCLIVADRAPALVSPVAATGALALTAYTAHLLAIWALGPSVVWESDAATWLWFLVATVACCWLWRAAFGRGPLERLLHTLAGRAADITPDTLPAPAPARP